MADIDQIIAGGAGASTRADFSKLPGILDAYYKGQDQFAKTDLRDAFADGVPTDASGQPDFGAMAKTLFQKGALDQGVAASNLALQRQQLQLGQQAAAGMGSLESGGQPAQPTIVAPPSSNRSASTIVAPALNKGRVAPPQDGQQGSSATLPQILTAQGIPNDQIGAVSTSLARQLGLQDPSAPINIQDPQVRNILVPAIAQLKRMGVGQVAQPGQPQQQDIPPVNPQQAPGQNAPQPNPQQNQGTFGAPLATPNRGSVPTGIDPEIQKQIATYTYIASNPAYPKSVQDAAMTRLKALQDQNAPTPDIKNYDLSRRQGYQGTLQDFMADNEAKKTGATEEAKLNATKYQTIVDNGTKAQQEIPQLQMLQTQMNDPNFFSGAGEKYNLLYKRLQSAVGMDPNVAVPQEFLRKATAANVLSSLGALKGVGQIRNAEIKMAQTASAAPENSIPANKLLVEISLRTHQRNADIADMAQDYKEKNGTLDAGFDKLVTQYGRTHPLFSDSEIKDWKTVIGSDAKSQSGAPAGFPNARKAPDGNFYTPDPGRPGKYLKIVQ